jgi:hypothetical protein
MRFGRSWWRQSPNRTLGPYLATINRIRALWQELVVAVRSALALGLHHPPLAEVALAALERWEAADEQAPGAGSDCPPGVLPAVAPAIVRWLDPYLMDLGAAAGEAPEAEEASEEAGAGLCWVWLCWVAA